MTTVGQQNKTFEGMGQHQIVEMSSVITNSKILSKLQVRLQKYKNTFQYYLDQQDRHEHPEKWEQKQLEMFRANPLLADFAAKLQYFRNEIFECTERSRKAAAAKAEKHGLKSCLKKTTTRGWTPIVIDEKLSITEFLDVMKQSVNRRKEAAANRKTVSWGTLPRGVIYKAKPCFGLTPTLIDYFRHRPQLLADLEQRKAEYVMNDVKMAAVKERMTAKFEAVRRNTKHSKKLICAWGTKEVLLHSRYVFAKSPSFARLMRYYELTDERWASRDDFNLF